MNRTALADWYGEVERCVRRPARALRHRLRDGPVDGRHAGAAAGRGARRRGGRRRRWSTRALATERRDARLLPLASRLVGSFPGIASDIRQARRARAGLRPAAAQGGAVAAAGLARGAPRPGPDHLPGARLPQRGRPRRRAGQRPGAARGLAGGTVEERVLADSYHVATLDHDAPAIFAGSVDFVRSPRAGCSGLSVPDPTEPAGRRANGLPASDWGALVDLDPRLSEGLLDRLAAAGVAGLRRAGQRGRQRAPRRDHAAAAARPAVGRPGPRRPGPSRSSSSEVADLTALLAEDDPGATAHGLVHPVPRTAAARVLAPPTLPGPPVPPLRAESHAAGARPPAPQDGRPPRPPPPSDDDVFAALVAPSTERRGLHPRAGRPRAGRRRAARGRDPPAATRRGRRPAPCQAAPGRAAAARLGRAGGASRTTATSCRRRPRRCPGSGPAPSPRCSPWSWGWSSCSPRAAAPAGDPVRRRCGLGLLAGGAAAMVWSMRDARRRADDGRRLASRSPLDPEGDDAKEQPCRSARRSRPAGHLMDTGVLANVLDDVLAYGGDYRIDRLDVGRAHADESYARIVVVRRRRRGAAAAAHAAADPRRQPGRPRRGRRARGRPRRRLPRGLLLDDQPGDRRAAGGTGGCRSSSRRWTAGWSSRTAGCAPCP